MARDVTISARIAPDLDSNLERLAAATGRTKSWLLNDALAGYIAREMEFVEAVQVGLNERAQGKFIEHAEIGVMIEARKRARTARSRKRA
jgi:predicted transcriptional regulator